MIGSLPYDIPHTDETRVQAEPELIQQFRGLTYYISTKMDGSSHSLGIDENGFHVTGHNFEYKDDGSSSFYDFIKSRGYQQRMEEFARRERLARFTIQGEFCAPGIQSNRLRLARPEWYVFTIRENGRRVGLDRMLEICKELDMLPVPIEEVEEDLPSHYAERLCTQFPPLTTRRTKYVSRSASGALSGIGLNPGYRIFIASAMCRA